MYKNFPDGLDSDLPSSDGSALGCAQWARCKAGWMADSCAEEERPEPASGNTEISSRTLFYFLCFFNRTGLVVKPEGMLPVCYM